MMLKHVISFVDMSTTQFFIGMAVFFLGAFIQSITGFGMGLISIPLLLIAGFKLPIAVFLVVIAGSIQSAYNLLEHRDHIQLKPLLPIIMIRFAFMPLGLFVLTKFSSFDPVLVRQIMGGVLLVVLSAQFFLKVRPVEKVHWTWTLLAGSMSGFMGTAVGIGGPPLVLWCQAHNWSMNRYRTSIWAASITHSPFFLASFLFIYGGDFFSLAGISLLLVPITLLGASLGTRLSNNIQQVQLQNIVFLLLLATSLNFLLEPFF